MRIAELSDLQVASGRWDEFVDQLEASGFSRRITNGIDEWLDREVSASIAQTTTAAPLAETQEGRRALADFSNRLISAENVGDVPKPLVTTPLNALAERFRAETPIAVSEGGKGTGKTLTARYLVSQLTWDRAVEEFSGAKDAVEAYILPVCGSIQSSGSFQKQIDEARARVAARLSLNSPQAAYRTISWLRDQRKNLTSEQQWVEAWLDCTAWSAGFKSEIPGVGPEFLEYLRSTGKTIVAVFEGLEELYESAADAGVSDMMRAILIALPQRLRSEAKRPVGIITFARRDTIEAGVRQNLDQYRREYAAFALSWTEDDVLELAAWLATNSGAVSGLWTPEFGALPQSEKATALEVLWGRKLGRDEAPGRRVQEAYTHTWVIAVLSDLQGKLVPRDLVRLLANAAGVTPTPEEEKDFNRRLLVPRALRVRLRMHFSGICA